MSTHNSFFRESLLEWYDPERRPLPWKNEESPYRIWLSEIILQQTRVEQGMPYYLKFIQQYPTVHNLAQAPDDEVMKTWEGLGYYSRARNMLKAARLISEEKNGLFPSTYEGLLSLPGVGPYTAAAIASFAHNAPHAVLDGNVYRVLARFFGIRTPSNTTAGKNEFAQLAQELLPEPMAGTYNQAIMDFGATVCTPKSPKCTSCPMQTHCQAHQLQLIDQLPVKQPKAPRRIRHFHFLVFNWHKQVLIERREQKDIWRNLYTFPILEADQFLKTNSLHESFEHFPIALTAEMIKKESWSKPRKQLLTHQEIRAVFIKIDLSSPQKPLANTGHWIPRKEIGQYAFPRVVDWYLNDKSLYLNI